MIFLSTRNCKNKRWKEGFRREKRHGVTCAFSAIVILWAAAFLTGCEGPSTTVLTGNGEETSGSGSEKTELAAASPEGLFRAVESLCGEDPAAYLSGELKASSYEVTEGEGILQAVMQAEAKDADLILLFACYGGENLTSATETSGAALLLLTAEILKAVPTDTEVRFVFLPGTREDLVPVRRYLAEFDPRDRNRLLGAVFVGPLGMSAPAGSCVCCEEGKETFLSGRLNRACRDFLGTSFPCEGKTEPVQNVLLRNRIPTVAFEEKILRAEAGTYLDRPSLIDYDSLAVSTDLFSHMLTELCSFQTPSMQARAHFGDEIHDGAFTQGARAVLPFGKGIESLEQATGLNGEQIFENTDNAGNELSGTRYPMRWFGGEEILFTDCYTVEDRLSNVRIGAFEAGIGFEEARERITAMYGYPSASLSGPYGQSYEWTVPKYRITYGLTPLAEGYEISAEEYDTPKTLLPSDSLGADRVRNLTAGLIPDSDQERLSVFVYSDGCGASCVSLERAVGPGVADNASGVYELGVDLVDAFDDQGAFTDEYATIGDILCCYGAYLAEAYPALYADGFRSRFGGDTREFAGTFCLFVLAGEPEAGIGPAADQLRYFYDFEDLTSYRGHVRQMLP